MPGRDDAVSPVRLDEVLGRQLDRLMSQAVENHGVSNAEIESLERLSRLAELARSRGSRRGWRLVAVATVFAGAVLASALAIVRTSSMEVLLDASVSAVTFGVAGDGASPIVSASVPLVRFEAAGIAGATVPTSIAHQRRTTTDPNLGLEVINAASGAAIELQPRTAGEEVTVLLRVGDAAYNHEMRVVGDSGEYQLVVSGRILVTASSPEVVTIPRDRPRLVRLAAMPDGVDFNLELAGRDAQLFVATTEVDSLSLFHDVQLGDAVGGRTHRLSSIDSGTVAYESVDREDLSLRPGEALWLRGARGRIHNLRLGEETISFRFQGRVRGLRIGAGSVQRNLMPTWMEWLSARAVIPFVWGTTLYLLGTVLAVLRWWRKPE